MNTTQNNEKLDKGTTKAVMAPRPRDITTADSRGHVPEQNLTRRTKTSSLRRSRVNLDSAEVGATGPPRDERMGVQSTEGDFQDLGAYTIAYAA